MEIDPNLVKAKAREARDKFADYITNLIGASATRRATQDEIELFDLGRHYVDDDILSIGEVGPLRTNVNNLDIDGLIDAGLVRYHERSGRFSVLTDIGDFNNDGISDLQDISAANYVLNFNGSSIDALEEVLNIAGNNDAIAAFTIRGWAEDRGFPVGSEQFSEFFNFFFGLYASPDFEIPLTNINRLLELYDAGLGQNDLSELDDYVVMVLEDQPYSLMAALFNAERSLNLSPQKRREYISILLDPNNAERANVLASALRSRRVPMTGETLSVEALDEVLAVAGLADETALFRIRKWADARNLSGEVRAEFINKFFNDYYVEEELGNSIQDLNNLIKIYDSLRNQDPQDFDINKLDLYASALENNEVSFSEITLMARFEMSPEFNLRGTPDEQRFQRDELIANYLDIFSEGDPELKTALLQAFKFRRIPITNEELNIENLQDFINQASLENGIRNITIDQWAKDRGLINNPNIPADRYDEFVAKINFWIEEGNTMSEVRNMLSLIDDGAFELYQLDVYAEALRNKIKFSQVADVYKFESSNGVTPGEFITYFIDGNKEQQQILSASFRAARRPNPKIPLTQEDLTVENLRSTLDKLDEEYGFAELSFDRFAKDRNFTPGSPGYREFTDTLMRWHQEEEISLNDIKNLLRIYDDENHSKDFEDLLPYVGALQDAVPFSSLITIYNFESNYDFTSSAQQRLTIESYMEILANGSREKVRYLLTALQTGQVPILGEELTVRRLNEVLDKVDDEDQLLPLYIEKWASDEGLQDFQSSDSDEFDRFSDSLLRYRSEFGLSISELSRVYSLYKMAEGDLGMEDLEIYASAIANKVKYSNLATIFSKQLDRDFRSVDEDIRYFIDQVLVEGTRRQQQILLQSLRSPQVPFSGQDSTAPNIRRMLEIAEDEDQLVEFIVGQWAEEADLTPGSNRHTDFMSKFYNEYYLDRGLNTGQLRNLVSLYDQGFFKDEHLDMLANAMLDGIPTNIIFKFQRFAESANIGDQTITRYINILLGAEGESVRKILYESIRSQYIPISNTKLF